MPQCLATAAPRSIDTSFPAQAGSGRRTRAEDPGLRGEGSDLERAVVGHSIVDQGFATTSKIFIFVAHPSNRFLSSPTFLSSIRAA